jgi:hypothetical protein
MMTYVNANNHYEGYAPLTLERSVPERLVWTAILGAYALIIP